MRRLPLLLTLTLFLLPLFGVALYIVVDEFKDHGEIARASQDISVHIAASVVKEKLDHIVDISVSLARMTLLRQAIENGKWEDALNSAETASKEFPYIDAINLFDSKGILKAMNSRDFDRSIIGKDFSYRDYYLGVSKKWEPYVSEVFKKMTEPRYRVIAIAIPVRSDAQKVLGVLVVNIKSDIFTEWANSINAGSSGFVYIVDQKGHLVVHHRLTADGDVVDYSLAPAVQKVLRGEHGVEVLADPMENEKQLVAYAPIPLYGWGVAMLRPESVAYLPRNTEATRLFVIFTLGIFVIGFSLYRILRSHIIMKAQRDRETLLLESIGDGVVAIDRNWNITLWNKSASVLTGWSKEEALGRSFRTVLMFIREQDRTEDILFIEDAMVRGKATTMSDNTLLVRKDGSEIAVGDSAAPIFGKGEKPDGAIIVFHDMSKSREATHLRSDFMYASHQLRTPVTEALWNLEIAIDEQDPEKRKEDLRIVHQSLLSVKKLSEHLVDVSEIDQGNVSVNSSAVKLIDVLTETQDKLETEADARGVTISIDPVSPIMAINTDQKFLTKILFEVVENAVMYSLREANVAVKTILKEKELIIEVADTGVGILEQEQVLIFTKFFRGSNRGSENIGDGLGLYLAKAYTALLGGKIWFESEEGKGTTFFISLPIV